MCLALPARVVERRADDQALVDLGGVRKEVSIALVPQAEVGDYVIVHVGFAIGMIDPEEAQRTLALMSELQAAAPPTERPAERSTERSAEPVPTA